MPNLFSWGKISSEVINPEDKPLIVYRPKELIEEDALSYYYEKRSTDSFHRMVHDEPHMLRRKAILQKYPQIKALFGKDPLSIFIVFGILIIQFIIAYHIHILPLWAYILFMYSIGGILNHALFVLIHDLTHYTCFESKFWNQVGAIIANIPQGIPSSVSFGRYHRDHHTYLGIPTYDPDLPTSFEVKWFKSTIIKALFLLFLPVFYSLKPYFVRPKGPVLMEVANLLVVFCTNYLVNKYMGIWALLYLLGSTWFGLSTNPVAAHIIAEHYEFVKGQETYSYYGNVNLINLNIGYHIEHHDFPMIPWRKLPMLRFIAPEFYDNLPHHTSYVKLMLRYVFDPLIGSWARIGRIPLDWETNKFKDLDMAKKTQQQLPKKKCKA